MRSAAVACFCAGSIALGVTVPASAEGWLRKPLNFIKPGLGDRADELHRKLKDAIPAYKKLEETSSAEVSKAGKTAVTTTEKLSGNIVIAVKKATTDIVATYEKGWRDTTEQAKRSFKDAVDAGKAVERFGEREFRDAIKASERAGKRIGKGDPVGALWGFSTDQVQSTERNFGKAAKESQVLNAAAQAAAAAYGGPAGAAAYAAWSTYNATGDANLALKAGIMSAATSASGSVIKMPANTTTELFQKSVVAGASGGIAVAAAGGDDKAVANAFLKSGGSVFIQGASNQLGAYSPQAKDALQGVQCISARNVDCLSNTTYARDAKGRLMDAKGKILTERDRLRAQIAKIDPKLRIGEWSSFIPGTDRAKDSEIMAKISKLPGTQSIPLGNNQWVLSWTLGQNKTISSDKPAVVLTYVGEDPPFYSKTTYQEPKVDMPATRSDWVKTYLTPPENRPLPAESWTVRVWHPGWYRFWPANPWPVDGFEDEADRKMTEFCKKFPAIDFYTWQIQSYVTNHKYYSVIEIAFNLTEERAQRLVDLLISKSIFPKVDKRQLQGKVLPGFAQHCSLFE